MYPSLNARFVRPYEQVMGISEDTENLLSHSRGSLVERIYG